MEPYLTSAATIAALFFLACASPGPDFINITSYALVSRRAGFAAASGAVFGVMVLASLIAIALATASIRFSNVYHVLRAAGAIYLAYLGCKTIKGALLGNEAPIRAASSQRSYIIFFRGMLINLANPKAAFFIASIFTTALPTESEAEAYMISVLVVTLVACGVYATISLTFSHRKVQSMYQRVWRGVDASLGVGFIVLAANLALAS